MTEVDTTADPGCFAMTGCGMAILFIAFMDCAFIDFDSVCGAMIYIQGGLSLAFYGCMSWNKGIGYDTTIGIIWSMFFFIYASIYSLANLGFVAKPDHNTWLVFYLIWISVSIYITIASLFQALEGLIFYVLLDVYLILLAIGEGAPVRDVQKAAGYVGMMTGAFALFIGHLIVIKHTFKRKPFYFFPKLFEKIKSLNQPKLKPTTVA